MIEIEDRHAVGRFGEDQVVDRVAHAVLLEARVGIPAPAAGVSGRAGREARERRARRLFDRAEVVERIDQRIGLFGLGRRIRDLQRRRRGLLALRDVRGAKVGVQQHFVAERMRHAREDRARRLAGQERRVLRAVEQAHAVRREVGRRAAVACDITRAVEEVAGIGAGAAHVREAVLALVERVPVALVADQRIAMAEIEAQERARAVVGIDAPAIREARARRVAAARDAGVCLDLAAGEIAAQDDVDDARDRVGAVDRRGAVAQDLDAIDDRERDAREVGHARGVERRDAVPGDAAPVDEDQRVLGAEPPERDRGGTGSAGLERRAARRGHRLGLVGDFDAGLRAQEVEQRGVAARVDLLAVDLGDRDRRFGGHPLRPRSADENAGELGRRVELGRVDGDFGRWRVLGGEAPLHDVGIVRGGDRGEPGAREDAGQGVLDRILAVDCRGAPAGHERGVVEDLDARLRGDRVQRVAEVARVDAKALHALTGGGRARGVQRAKCEAGDRERKTRTPAPGDCSHHRHAYRRQVSSGRC